MDQALQDDLRRQLEDELATERARLEDAEPIEQDKELHNLARGESGQSQAAENIRQRSERLATIDHTESRAAKIEHALERMDQGSYGTCEVCGRGIGEERLRAYPAATRCIEDAEDDVRPAAGTD
ncbi:MAG: TraR/DksA C4-type zinc finger protein [Actinobacteria bacterium]|nr:TraR/DksA C4-type zinc finger protein [Actinomycetota bacterium]